MRPTIYEKTMNKKINLHITDEDHKYLFKIAKKRGVKASEIVRSLIRNFIQERKGNYATVSR